MPPLGGFPSEYCYAEWRGYPTVKKFDDMFIRFDTTHDRDRLHEVKGRAWCIMWQKCAFWCISDVQYNANQNYCDSIYWQHSSSHDYVPKAWLPVLQTQEITLFATSLCAIGLLQQRCWSNCSFASKSLALVESYSKTELGLFPDDGNQVCLLTSACLCYSVYVCYKLCYNLDH